jgi:hypothetical protein
MLLTLSNNSTSAFTVTSSVVTGSGSLNLYKGGKNLLPTTILNIGDTVIVYASPAENAALSFLTVGSDVCYSSPVQVIINGDIDVTVGFETKSILLKETFGIASAYATKLNGATPYANYDTPMSVAEIIPNETGGNSNTSILNLAQKTDDPFYSVDSVNNPHSTHVYLQASNVVIKFAAGKALTGQNMQIKFRYLPVQSTSANTHFNFSSLQVKINNITQPPLVYGNSVKMPFFWINPENPLDPESPNLIGITSAHRAPFVVVPITSNYSSVSQIIVQQIQQSVPFINRGRLDDIIVVGDVASGLSDVNSIPTVFAVETNRDIEFRGSMQVGTKISVYSMLGGTEVRTKIITSNRELISTSSLPAGVYIGKVKDTNGCVNSFKLIVK